VAPDSLTLPDCSIDAWTDAAFIFHVTVSSFGQKVRLLSLSLFRCVCVGGGGGVCVCIYVFVCVFMSVYVCFLYVCLCVYVCALEFIFIFLSGRLVAGTLSRCAECVTACAWACLWTRNDNSIYMSTTRTVESSPLICLTPAGLSLICFVIACRCAF
jgi:hypothetical protein